MGSTKDIKKKITNDTLLSSKRLKKRNSSNEPKEDRKQPQNEGTVCDVTQVSKDAVMTDKVSESATTTASTLTVLEVGKKPQEETNYDDNMKVSDSSVSASKAIIAPPPKGRNVSGRSWKSQTVQKRASSLIKTKVNNLSKTWEIKMNDKNERKYMLEIQKEMIDMKKKAKLDKKQRQLENDKRRMENEYNNVKNAAQSLNQNKLRGTLKAMSKKQLRQIKKTKLNTKTGVVEYVPLYTK